MSDQAVFVTGGSGFVGRNLLPTLVQHGWEVRALARSLPSAAAVMAGGAQVIHGDLEDPVVLEAGMRGCSVAIHAAADTRFGGPPEEFERANVRGTANVLEAAARAGINRFVYISTDAVLARRRPIVRADETWRVPGRPIGLYSRTKASAERLVLTSDRFETVSVRPRFVWGVGDTVSLAGLLKAVAERRFYWIAGGRYLTTTCHVTNLVSAVITACSRGCGPYFVADEDTIELRSWITQLLATQGVSFEAPSIPAWLGWGLAVASEPITRLSGGKWYPPIGVADMALRGHEVTLSDQRARDELGYRPIITRSSGLEELRHAAFPLSLSHVMPRLSS